MTPDGDIDLLVDLVPGGGNELLRVSGVAEELSELLGTRVDVVATSLLRGEVSMSALADAVAVRAGRRRSGSPTSSALLSGVRSTRGTISRRPATRSWTTNSAAE
ncbi:MAG: nucleotidyltransferase family protein [Dermatophilaceae bacterium]